MKATHHANRLCLILLLALTGATGLRAQVLNNGFEQINGLGNPSHWGRYAFTMAWFDSLGQAHTDSIVYDGPLFAPAPMPIAAPMPWRCAMPTITPPASPLPAAPASTATTAPSRASAHRSCQ